MNTDRVTTWLGLLQAVGVAIVDVVMTSPVDPTESRWTNPMFWVGILVAALMATKAYYTKGIETTAPTATKGLPIILGAIMVLGLTACAHSDLLPNGMYVYQFKAERPNWSGTNTTMTRGAQCPSDLTTLQDWTPEYADAVKLCTWVQSEWHDASSQGQIGQIVSGVFIGTGAGVAGALVGDGLSSATSAATAAASKGGKGH